MPYLLKLKEKKEIAKDTMAFYFEKPENFEFTAGQSMRLTSSQVPESRTLSIVSAPHEEELLFAMRMRGSLFKKSFANLKSGESVEADGPFGERFVLHSDTKIPAVFIAGGVGITPLLSMLEYITEKNISYRVTLFYSNRKKEDVAFLEQLKSLEERNENLKIIFTLTKPTEGERETWEGEIGYINKEMLKHYLNNITESMYYISGPPEMVVGMKSTLEKAGIHTESIITKKFSGY